jgi:hypothetical protein
VFWENEEETNGFVLLMEERKSTLILSVFSNFGIWMELAEKD